MATPAMSCSTDALSSAPIADSDDEVDEQSPMWVQEEADAEEEEEEDRASADLPADAEDQTSADLPADFLEPLSPGEDLVPPLPPFPTGLNRIDQREGGPANRQFWKSGDFVGSFEGASFATEGMDHARVHPKFLHSNATSHKWVLGAIAELLDNAVDEIRNGATFVKIDVQQNPRNKEPMLVIEDDGGGMDPDCMRRCMSLGYSAKSKVSGTIGQYGNGFKTSTMRLGADVIVFSRNQRNKPSESIGMMSYTFLTSTGQNDVVVPIVDFQLEAFGVRKLIRTNVDDWMESMQTIQDWSPFSSQAELLSQFRSMPRRQGTKVIIYNLWQDEEGRLELDFDADSHDIQIRAITRDEKVLKLAARFPSCKHYLTHKHSLQTYISILYLRLPARFRILLRGTEVLHHSLQKEMMLVEQVTYRPKDLGNSKAVVTLGFIKDAAEHIDISGFNVYHKNRLIKPFWRIWNSSDTRGRGIIAILEANFVEPAHDKQGFERTIVLTRLEARLTEMQKSYWNKFCHKIGYTNASLRKPGGPHSKDSNSPAKGSMKKLRTGDVVLATSCAHTEQVGPKQAIQTAHDNNTASEFSDALGGLPAVTMQTTQKAPLNSSIVEMEESNLMPITLTSSLDSSTKSGEMPSSRQEPFYVEPILTYTPQSVRDAPTSSLPRVVPNTTLNRAELNSQESPTSCTIGNAPEVIDLDPPDVDKKCHETDFGVPSPQNLDCEVQRNSEVMHLKSRNAANAYENSPPSDAAAELATKREAQKSFDASIYIPAPGDKASQENVAFNICSREDSTGARTDEHCPNGHVESNAFVTAATEGRVAAAMALVDQCKEVDLETTDRCTAAPNTLVEGCKQVELEASEKAVLVNSACSVVDILTTNELDDFFDSLEGPSNNSPSIKDRQTFVPVSEIEIVLPDQEESGALEVPLFSSANLPSQKEVASDFRNEDVIVEQEDSNIIMSQVSYKTILNDSVLTPLPLQTAITLPPDMDEVMIDVNGQENDEPEGTKQDSGSNHERMEYQQMDERMAVALQNDADFYDKKNCCMPVVELQDHENMATLDIHDEKDSLTVVMGQYKDEDMAVVVQNKATDLQDENDSQGLIQAKSSSKDQKSSLAAAVNTQEYENMAIVLQNETSLDNGNDSQGDIQASCLDIVSFPTTVMADAVNDSIADSINRDLLKEERFIVAKQQIDYLQQSIEAIVVEVDDLKEQVQQERELQQVELTNLHMELERALLRLEELRG